MIGDVASACRRPERAKAGPSTTRWSRLYCSSRAFGERPLAKQEDIVLDGTVSEILPNATFRVVLENGHEVLATMAGKMRRFRIRVLMGDRVTMALSPYDLTRGRITYRHKT